jgi:amino acid adenylation domain-containing protein
VSAEPGAAHRFTLGAELKRALGATGFELLLAAVHVLLRRYGEQEPVVAVDMSTRAAAAAVGTFVHELPVSAPPLAGVTYRQFVDALRVRLREIYPLRSVPLARAVTGLPPRLTLTPVSLSYRRLDPQPPAFRGVDATITWTVPPPVARNALHIMALDGDTDVSIDLHHAPAAIAPAAVAAIAGHLRRLLAAALAAPDTVVGALDLLPAGERDRLVSGWNATARPYPPDQTLVDLFERQVARNPDAPAAVGADRTLTYAQLDRAATRLAQRLRAAGVRRGSRVAVFLERTTDTLVALLAAARAALAYVPVDPAYPPAKCAQILLDAAPALVLTSRDFAARLGPAPRLLMDDDDGAGAQVELGRPGADEPAYVIYTSGSTGRPKGVVVSHGALANLLAAMHDEVGGGAGDPWLAHTALSFDIAALELFAPLVAGAPVVIATAGQTRSGAALLRLVREHRVTRVQATPSGWRMLLDAGFGAEQTPERGRVVALAGGETLPLPLARDIRPRVRRLVNVYGPTETTIWSTLADLPDPVDEVTIGRPIANTRVYLLDEQGRPVPAGTPAELYIGGRGIAAGYLGRPELTAARFVPDPFGAPGERLYRTGDRVRYRPDGRLVFLGRTDDQVKIRGHRVELGEVEARLAECPGVRQAAAALRTLPSGESVLVAYVVAGGAVAPTPDGLGALLHRTLPAAMVPTAWMTLDRLPLTANGKVDRAALPTPVLPAAGAEPPPADPSPAEPDEALEEVRAIWQEVLKVEPIGDEDDLFDLGGHSLTALMINDRIEARFGTPLPLDAFYETSTLVEIAGLVRKSREGR